MAKKKINIKKNNSAKKKKKYQSELTESFQSDINELINKIDNNLNSDLKVDSITVRRWNNLYKKEILNLLNSKHELTEDDKDKIIEMLNIFFYYYFTKNESKKLSLLSVWRN